MKSRYAFTLEALKQGGMFSEQNSPSRVHEKLLYCFQIGIVHQGINVQNF